MAGLEFGNIYKDQLHFILTNSISSHSLSFLCVSQAIASLIYLILSFWFLSLSLFNSYHVLFSHHKTVASQPSLRAVLKMPSLTDLFPEILEEIVVKLESVEDMISLGSSCNDLARVVGQERLWRAVLVKTQLVEEVEDFDDDDIMEDRVSRITTFVASSVERDSIFSLLHQMIYERYPASIHGQGSLEEDSITVSFPPSPQLHSVSGVGLKLLALTGTQGARHVLHKVNMYFISPSMVLHIASLKMEQFTELVAHEIWCETEEQGKALVSLLESCNTWRVGWLGLDEEVGVQTWEGLGREVVKGRLGNIVTGRRVVRRGRVKDLLAVWENTEVGWGVDWEDPSEEGVGVWDWDGEPMDGVRILKEDGEENGWDEIKEIF